LIALLAYSKSYLFYLLIRNSGENSKEFVSYAKPEGRFIIPLMNGQLKDKNYQEDP